MIEFLKKNIFIIFISSITLFIGFLTFLTFIDRSFIEAMKDLIFEGKIQFIGSGYAQLIGPLVPTQLNNWNISHIND